MRSLDVIFICMAIALGTSILYMLAVQFFPEQINYAAVIAGVIAMCILLICCVFYPTAYVAEKWIFFVILLILVVITIFEVLLNDRKNLKVHGILLKQATKMVAARLHVLLYIPLFLGIAFLFSLILVYEFKSIWTQGTA